MAHTAEVSGKHFEEFCRRWRVVELSVNRDSVMEHPDNLEMSIRFDTEAEWSLTDRIRMQHELQNLSGQSIRLHHRPSIRYIKRRPSMSVLFDA